MKLPITTIVAAVDLDDELGESVLRTGVALAERFGATLHVIDAWPNPENVGFPYARKAEIAELKKYEHERSQRRLALEVRAKALAPQAIVAAPVGKVSQTIATYVESQNTDLLVIGSHQKSFWERLVAGSVSERVLHTSPCAVFLVTEPFADRITIA